MKGNFMLINIFEGILIPFVGTTLGAACVFFMRKTLSKLLQRALAGFAAGIMVAASIPGAGGSINDDGILDAALTPRLIQPTTFAEISENKSERTKQFSEILRHAHIPYKKVMDMHLWQLCHLAMVVPIADAYYESDDPEKVEKEWKIMRKTAERLKRNFNFLRKQKGKLSPWKMNIFCFLPLSFLTIMLAVTFGSSFGDKFMYQHATKAPDEMRELHKQFYAYIKRMKKCGCKTKKVL